MELTYVVRDARRRSKLGQAEFAARLGLTREQVISLESHRFVSLTPGQQEIVASLAEISWDLFSMIYTHDEAFYGEKKEEDSIEELARTIRQLPEKERLRLLGALQNVC